ncbi:MAG: acetyl ornithine aminotransferase family protein [Deltaproteobacteria bacterium]|nr:acetyl ornithine aminotransferase family protein [Deltaproteobacteria bacterium]MBI3076890.1 acetyl ornithine aminotransferase family protein [Deltaproteobacteria bacterium]
MARPERPHLLVAPPGPRARALVARDRDLLSPSLTRSYPAAIERGEGCWVWDVDGNRYLDFAAGIAVCATGHCHPDVVAAIREQAGQLLHIGSGDFYSPRLVELADALLRVAPIRGRKQVFFCNSGAEAIESALKLARYHTKRHRVVAFMGAFHGRTMGAISLTGSKVVQRRSFAPFIPEVTHIPYGYCYRCAYLLEYPRCELWCARYLEEMLFETLVPPEEVAAIFVEPIQGEGGIVVPPPEYHRILKGIAEKYGILYVVDEVQTGMGRTGKMFAIEHWGVEPDIIAVAKGIASGLPLGAMIARADLMSWEAGAHGTTFGGNPVSCAAALATLRLLEGGLVENAARRGEQLLGRLIELREKYPCLGDVRGKGLLVGAEIVEDQRTRARAPGLRDRILEECFRRGLLLLGAGASAIRFTPPLVVTEPEVDTALEIFEEGLRAAA